MNVEPEVDAATLIAIVCMGRTTLRRLFDSLPLNLPVAKLQKKSAHACVCVGREMRWRKRDTHNNADYSRKTLTPKGRGVGGRRFH